MHTRILDAVQGSGGEWGRVGHRCQESTRGPAFPCCWARHIASMHPRVVASPNEHVAANAPHKVRGVTRNVPRAGARTRSASNRIRTPCECMRANISWNTKHEILLKSLHRFGADLPSAASIGRYSSPPWPDTTVQPRYASTNKVAPYPHGRIVRNMRIPIMILDCSLRGPPTACKRWFCNRLNRRVGEGGEKGETARM